MTARFRDVSDSSNGTEMEATLSKSETPSLSVSASGASDEDVDNQSVVSDLNSVNTHAFSVRRNGVGGGVGGHYHAGSDDPMRKYKSIIAKLKRENVMLNDSLQKANVIDITLLQGKLRGANADMVRLKQQNSELKDRVQSLEGRVFELLAEMSSVASSNRVGTRQFLQQKHYSNKINNTSSNVSSNRSMNSSFDRIIHSEGCVVMEKSKVTSHPYENEHKYAHEKHTDAIDSERDKSSNRETVNGTEGTPIAAAEASLSSLALAASPTPTITHAHTPFPAFPPTFAPTTPPREPSTSSDALFRAENIAAPDSHTGNSGVGNTSGVADSPSGAALWQGLVRSDEYRALLYGYGSQKESSGAPKRALTAPVRVDAASRADLRAGDDSGDGGGGLPSQDGMRLQTDPWKELERAKRTELTKKLRTYEKKILALQRQLQLERGRKSSLKDVLDASMYSENSTASAKATGSSIVPSEGAETSVVPSEDGEWRETGAKKGQKGVAVAAEREEEAGGSAEAGRDADEDAGRDARREVCEGSIGEGKLLSADQQGLGSSQMKEHTADTPQQQQYQTGRRGNAVGPSERLSLYSSVVVSADQTKEAERGEERGRDRDQELERERDREREHDRKTIAQLALEVKRLVQLLPPSALERSLAEQEGERKGEDDGEREEVESQEVGHGLFYGETGVDSSGSNRLSAHTAAAARGMNGASRYRLHLGRETNSLAPGSKAGQGGKGRRREGDQRDSQEGRQDRQDWWEWQQGRQRKEGGKQGWKEGGSVAAPVYGSSHLLGSFLLGVLCMILGMLFSRPA